ncbi:MAG: response regulator [Marinilabiliaceae bacterium]|nr:response regulator [Marinilabiliaceae bacterium]
MNQMRALFFLLLLLLIPVFFYAQPGTFKFRRLNISDGLSNSQVRCVFVDRKGFAWIGTIAGLNRYDGYSIKVFRNDPADTLSLGVTSVYRIREDYDGNIWFFAPNNSFSIYDPLTETFGSNHELFNIGFDVDRNNISELLIDNQMNLWLSNNTFGIFCFDRKRGVVKNLIHSDKNEKSLISDRIFDIAKDSHGDIWSINSDGVVEKIDHNTFDVVDRISIQLHLKADGYQSLRLFIDSDDDIWVFSESDATGLYFYSQKLKRIVRFSSSSLQYRLNSDIITGIEQDEKGNIWIGTDHGGINIIDKTNFSVHVLLNEVGVDNSLSQNSVTAMHRDKNGIIWVGTYKNGLNYYHPHLFQFGLEKHHPFRKGGLPANDINCFAEDNKGNLWIGTNGSGLIFYDNATGKYELLKHDPMNSSSLSNDVVVSLCMDDEGKLWIGTYYGGLNVFDGKIFTRYLHDPDNSESISDNRIWQIYQDSRQRIWIGTLGGGLDMYDNMTRRFLHFKAGALNSIQSDFVLSLMEHSNGTLWIGTASGIDVLDPRTGRFTHYGHVEGDSTTLGNDVVLSMCEDERGWLWIGTRGGLSCFDPKIEEFRRFALSDGLPDNNVTSVLYGDDGSIWISTLNGISNIRILKSDNLHNMQYNLHNYDVVDGLQGIEFNERSGFKTRKGELLFGGANGFNRFHPSDILNDSIVGNLILTNLKLNNQIVGVNESIEGRVILKKSISEQEKIVLKHNQNLFSIEFASINYLKPEKVQYRYKLEGFNNKWITVDARSRNATFTNLNPGDYVFKVVAYNEANKVVSNIASINIEVIPPFYATNIAYAIYIVLFFLIIVVLIRIIVRREHLKFEREQELTHHQRMHELDNMKIRFFTNISHEFRTPLTLILTPVEKLIKTVNDEELKGQLVIIQRNARRLLNLVNKLLDFRKMEVKNISINLSFGNIIRFMRETVDTFSDLSESKSIDLSFRSSINELFIYFDHDKIEKVLFNLLSNAFKFTPPNGLITVTVDSFNQGEARNSIFGGSPYIELRVADTGIGISKDKQELVFERFFQSDNSGVMVNQGSGIGLSLAQEFVRLHKGTIHVESELEQGSTFIVRLPIISDDGKNVDEAKATEVNEAVNEEIVGSFGDGDRGELVDVKHGNNFERVVIVEDNEDLRFYLKDNLKKKYQIIEAINGNDAWQKIIDYNPTLIVSDIMMPGMDGIELTKKVRSEEATSHIPVILLSARSTNEQKLEGFNAGADDYITKPFNYEILEIKIDKLINQRKDFQQSLHLHYEVKPGEIGVTSLDEKFIQKALQLVEENISNSDYSVEKLSKEMSVSRGHLYNKLSALTGKTPIEFIRVMRLKRAAQLLGKSQLTVSEIAFDVGFNDPKYFSKYFKDEFGISPSEYAKKVITEK